MDYRGTRDRMLLHLAVCRVREEVKAWRKRVGVGG